MFSINIYLRFALVALCLIGGTVLAFQFGFWYAFPFLLVGVFLLVGKEERCFFLHFPLVRAR